MHYLLIGVGCTIGNFLYEVLSKQKRWEVAARESFMQAAAIAMCAILPA
jgi:hypothetical protein